MERDPQFRYTRVVLIVEWDDTGQDHPLMWDYELLLGGRAEVIEAEDVDQEQEDAGGKRS